MNQPTIPVVIFYGMPVSFVCEIINKVSEPEVAWLVCDTDMGALAGVDDVFKFNDNVSLCIVTDFDTRNANAVLGIARSYSVIERDCIWFSGRYVKFGNEVRFFKRFEFLDAATASISMSGDVTSIRDLNALEASKILRTVILSRHTSVS